MFQTLLGIVFVLLPYFCHAQLTDSSSIPAQPTQQKDSATIISGALAPVLFKGDTLLMLQQSKNEYPVAFRAEQVSQRLEKIAEAFDPEKDSIYLVSGANSVSMMLNENLAYRITSADAQANDQALETFSVSQRNKLDAMLKADRPVKLTTKQYLIRIGYSILSLIGLIIMLKVISWVFRRIDEYLSKFERTFLARSNNIFKYFVPRKTANIFVFISNVLYYIAIILLLIAYLPFMFSFFPRMENLVGSFYGYLETPVKFIIKGFIDFLPSLIFILVILAVTRYVVRVLRYIADDIEEGKLHIRGFPKDWARMTQKIFSLFLYAFALVMIYPHLPGSTSPAFKGVSIFIGALLSFGSTSAVANIVAGVVITYMRAFQIGDRIKIQDTEGDVIEKTLLVTRIRTTKNVDVTIPNANLINNHLINYSANTKRNGLVLHTTVTIGYDVPWKKVEDLLLTAGQNSIHVEKEPPPFVLKTSLDDFYVSYQLNVYTKEAQKIPAIYSNIHQHILDVFNEAGVEILSPAYHANRDGNLTTVPNLLKEDAKSPFERIVDHLTGRNQQVRQTPGSPEQDTNKP